MDVLTAKQEFREIYEKIHAYTHAMSVIYLDSVTAAPPDTAEGRGKTMGILTGVLYDLQTGDRTKEIVKFLLDNKAELSERELRELDEFNRENEYISSIPRQEYVEYRMLINDAENVWHKAKTDNDFPAFAPYLQKIMDTSRRFAGYYRPEKPAYDVLLDMYERGLTMEQADKFFGELRGRIMPLLKKIASVPQVDDSFIHRQCPVWKQRQLSDYLMEVMGLDRRHCGIGETEHPFTIEFNKNDVRITTHYYEDSVFSSLFSVVHEGGHALYELHIGDDYADTFLGGGVSMGIHESQSRFYENYIGRSHAFSALILPKLKELFPEQMADITPEMLYRAVSKTEPSLIRVEADELTYPLHVMVRYELEKELIGGSLKVEDLPAAWNAKMKEYLGVDVPDDRRGVLQDSHWSGGNVGYFPSYALGSAYAAQIRAKIAETIHIDTVVVSGSLAPITAWLEERIFRYGRMYDPAVLLEKCCGAPFSPDFYVDYLEKKFGELYGV